MGSNQITKSKTTKMERENSCTDNSGKGEFMDQGLAKIAERICPFDVFIEFYDVRFYYRAICILFKHLIYVDKIIRVEFF